MNREIVISSDLKTYEGDGRLPIQAIYQRLSLLMTTYGWDYIEAFSQVHQTEGGEKNFLPICLFHSRRKGPALWIICGIHGEESAPPNAVADEIDLIGKVGKRIPTVLIWGNPLGYMKNWRYPDEPRDKNLGRSVGDTDHLIPSPANHNIAIKPRHSSPAAWYLANEVIKLSSYYPPELVIDLHEDEEDGLGPPPIYSHGILGAQDPIAQTIRQIIHKNGFHLENDSPVSLTGDGSIDDLLAGRQIIVDGVLRRGPSAKSVVVAETPTHTSLGEPYPFETRVEAHRQILKQAEGFYYKVLETHQRGLYA